MASKRTSISSYQNDGEQMKGFLLKRGGADLKYGWKKRWFTFDGTCLKYFESDKCPVSLRIIPVSIMKQVKRLAENSRKSSVTDRLLGNGAKFQFELVCVDRTYMIGSDTEETSIAWEQTLENAIQNYKESQPSAEFVVGGDMQRPDLAGFIRFDNNSLPYYVALKNEVLKYYRNEEDYNFCSAIHEIEMGMTSVKEIDRVTISLNVANNQSFTLRFDTVQDAANWVTAMTSALGKALGNTKFVDEVRQSEANRKCVDCNSTETLWASINLGIVMCTNCAGCHRSLGTSISKIRSLCLDNIFEQNPKVLQLLDEIGNERANTFWYKNPPDDRQITRETPFMIRRRHIHEKYAQKKFVDRSNRDLQEKIDCDFILAITSGDILNVMKLFFWGANIYGFCPQSSQTAMELAGEYPFIKEFLLQNEHTNIDAVSPPKTEEQEKRVSSVYCEGYLDKTGPNLKRFMKRRCILNHGTLTYYNENSKSTERGDIRLSDVVCIANANCKRPYAFDVSNKPKQRIYRFAAEDEDNFLKWKLSFAKAMSPVDMDEDDEFALFGIFYTKTHLSQWTRSLLVFSEHHAALRITNLRDDCETTIRIEKGIQLFQKNLKKHKVLRDDETIYSATLNQNCYIEIIPPDMTHVTSIQGQLLDDTTRLFQLLEDSLTSSSK
ncbi:arf-GAP with Rho-GAP domain, ANK repeat and PH domain-containing protein 1-like isoform X2 [Mya arenaria]|uniref:arf-GAP with Rho-GAP domain, ANK repeat and PH domain-containing protein 1-like isoform X2 n=1 Tax=Mya arenaria TaxID=6604 RepID=UPI0022E5B5D5|nr:arf-GAP with Rho-GAP domain, ANK repeat and PH domain-containing protein 1-like isoform X2 [Mya arenaria]